MKKKVILRGPMLTRSGYGEQTRFALRSLRSREDLFEIYLQPTIWGNTSWIYEDTEERRWVDERIEETIGFIQSGGVFDMSIQVTIPNEWEAACPVNIGYTAGIETTQVAHQWIQKGNEMDKIIVVSNHSKKVFETTAYTAHNEQSGETLNLSLETAVKAVNYPVKTYESLPDLDFELDTEFNFLAVAQYGPRKNIPNTIKWFVEEFHDDEVGLVLKSNISKNSLSDRRQLFDNLKNFLNNYPDRKCKIHLLHGNMTDEEMHALYTHPQISALVTLTHGEGFGLPIFEAAYSGLPVIAPGWSGQLDFLVDTQGQKQFYDVLFDIGPIPQQAVWDGVLIKESMWCYPREDSARQQMRLCYNQLTSGDASIDFNAYAEELKTRFSEDKMYAEFVDGLNLQNDFDVNSWLDSMEIEEFE